MSKIFEQGKNELVIHQDVARMRGTLTSIQSKGMNSILKRSFEQLQNNRTRTKFVFDTDTLLEDMQLDYKMGKKSKIETIYKPLDELSNKKFIWGTDKKINQAVFMQEFEITDETVTIVFSNYIRNKLEVINNALIINDFVTLQSFKSVYAERLYKQIQMWKDKGELILSIKDFKDFLGVPKSSAYTRMTNMKTKVLKVAIKEINEKSNFELHYEDIKKGRSITHFKFLWLYHDPAKYEKMEIDKRKREIKKLINMDFIVICCGGGGGMLQDSTSTAKRMITGRPKAEQMKAAGLPNLATACLSCHRQLGELSKHYKLGIKVDTVASLASEALIL